MFDGALILSTVKSVLIELCIGYFLFILLGNLFLIPGKDKIQKYVNEGEYKEIKKENIKARKWLCIIWTILVIGFNLYLICKGV